MPSNDKIYVLLSDTESGVKGNKFIARSTIATSDDGSGTITIDEITTNQGIIGVTGSFEINTTTSQYSTKVGISRKACQASLKNATVKIKKDTGSSNAVGNFDGLI